MCLRPDIVYVVRRAVYATYLMLEESGFHGHSVGFYNRCEEAEAAAAAENDGPRAQIWREVQDFGIRHCCSPLSAVEVGGQQVYASPMPTGSAPVIRLYIGNPRNPAHCPGQAGITAEVMAAVNEAWDPTPD